MPNKVAIALGLSIIALFVADQFWLHWELHIFLMKKLAEVSEWMAFWR